MISPLNYHASQARIEHMRRQSAEFQSIEREEKPALRTRLATLLSSRSAGSRSTPSWRPGRAAAGEKA